MSERRARVECLGLVGLLCVAACSSHPGSGSALVTHDEPGPFVGEVACDPGDRFCNGCVAGVESAYDVIARSIEHEVDAGPNNSYGSLTFPVRLPPYDWNTARIKGFDHIQTVHAIRPFTVATGSEWLVIDSQDQRYKVGQKRFHRGLVFARRNDTTGEMEGKYFYPIVDSPHPGGVQIANRYLAVGAECPNPRKHCPAFVDFFDLGDFATYEHETCSPKAVIHCDPSSGTCSGSPCGPARFANRLYLDGSRDEPEQGPISGRVSSVAFTRLADGHYFLYVSRGSRNAMGWYYRSDTTTIGRATKWEYVGAHTASTHVNPNGYEAWADANYQNVNFVTECETGRLHLVGLGSTIDLYALSVGMTANSTTPDFTAWTPTLDRVRSRSDGHCVTPRDGASIYVLPNETMGLYCIENAGKRRAAWQFFR